MFSIMLCHICELEEPYNSGICKKCLTCKVTAMYPPSSDVCEQIPETYECQCGSVVGWKARTRHFKTKKHLYWLEHGVPKEQPYSKKAESA